MNLLFLQILMAALYLARFRCVGFLTRTRSAFSPSLLRNRTCYFSAFIPIGLSIKNRYMVQCQTSPVGIPDVGSKLIYYHDSLAKLRRKRRNFIVAIYLAMRRFVRMCLRVCQLLIMYTPLLIAYPFMRGSENRLQRWRLWALYLVERSGPAFIKFAQWASTRRDLFSKEFCDLFSQLHTSTKPHSWKRTQKAMEEALGPDWRRFFQDFEEKPCGSGCVAQVSSRANVGSMKCHPVLACRSTKPGSTISRSIDHQLKYRRGSRAPIGRGWTSPSRYGCFRSPR